MTEHHITSVDAPRELYRPHLMEDALLAGTRVLDLTRNLAGPFCTMTLGDLGADVVKIEHPGTGDDTRTWVPPAWGGESATYLAANRNKRSMAVDLDDPDGRAIVAELARRADVLVHSFRPGSLERRGLGHEDLRTVNEGLVYCAISAFGPTGPRRDEPGYDPILQAYSGIMQLTGERDGPAVRLGVGAVDLGTALWATIGILAALAARKESGRGGLVTTSLFETATWWLSYHLAGYLGSGAVPRRQGSRTAFIAPYEAFATTDGQVFVAAANDRLFGALVEALGLTALAEDPRFATNPARAAHADELGSLLAPVFATRSAAEWEEVLRAASVPCSRVRSVDALAEDPQTVALGLLARVPRDDIADLRLVDLPVSRDGVRAVRHDPPPRLGEHTDEILSELGWDAADVARLRARGALG